MFLGMFSVESETYYCNIVKDLYQVLTGNYRCI
jgi:hypothetical protein